MNHGIIFRIWLTYIPVRSIAQFCASIADSRSNDITVISSHFESGLVAILTSWLAEQHERIPVRSQAKPRQLSTRPWLLSEMDEGCEEEWGKVDSQMDT